MLGGIRAVTLTQIAQYIVLIIVYLIPVFWMSNKQGFRLIPQFVYGDAVQRVTEQEQLHQVGGAQTNGVFCWPQAADRSIRDDRCWNNCLEICDPRLLYDGRYSIPAAHSDALLHNSFS